MSQVTAAQIPNLIRSMECNVDFRFNTTRTFSRSLAVSTVAQRERKSNFARSRLIAAERVSKMSSEQQAKGVSGSSKLAVLYRNG